MDLGEFRNLIAAVRGEIGKAVQGQDAIIDLVLISIFSGGHCLVEGPPGTAKTLLARSVSAAMALDYRRIQFTPDLMPGDVLGVNLFNFQTNQFHLTKGPVFTDILLADEINRAPPKTQSALLQAMNERMVTLDGVDYSLGPDFFVLATQNPIEQQGTYPLPEAQLDRFLFKLIVDFPDRDTEIAILSQACGSGAEIGYPQSRHPSARHQRGACRGPRADRCDPFGQDDPDLYRRSRARHALRCRYSLRRIDPCGRCVGRGRARAGCLRGAGLRVA